MLGEEAPIDQARSLGRSTARPAQKIHGRFFSDFLANFYGFYLNFGDNVVYVDPLFDNPVIYHCDLETVCIAGLESAVSVN